MLLVVCYASLIHFTGDSPPQNSPQKCPRKYALRPNEDGVLVDERVTRQQQKEAARMKVKVDPKKKGKSKRVNYKEDMDNVSYSAMRQNDWLRMMRERLVYGISGA